MFGQSFSRLSGFVRYGGSQDGYRSDDLGFDDDTDMPAEHDTRRIELFVDAGVDFNKVRTDLEFGTPITWSRLGITPHLALGGRREVTPNNDLGTRIEFDQVQGHSLIGIRALDYRHRFGEHLALGLFAGVDRYDLATPAYSIDYGVGTQWRDVVPKWDLGFDFRHGQNIARNHVLPTDIQGGRPDSFYKIEQALLYLSRKF